MIPTFTKSPSRPAGRRLAALLVLLILTLAPGRPTQAAEVGKAWFKDGLLFVQTGDYLVRFKSKSAWTIHSVDYKDKAILTPTGAYQSVLNTKGGSRTWIGTGHGGEVVQSIVLRVDGTPHELNKDLPLPGGSSLSGRSFVLEKSSRLGPYQHNTRVSVTPDGITENFHYKMVGEPIHIVRMYVFMHCFNNATRDWIVGLADGKELTGRFADDNSTTLRKTIRWAMVYAPSMRMGLVYAYPKAYTSKGTLRNFFWNRPRDNKLYFSVQPSEAPDAAFSYSVRLKAFSAGPDDWRAAGQRLLDPLLQSPSTQDKGTP